MEKAGSRKVFRLDGLGADGVMRAFRQNFQREHGEGVRGYVIAMLGGHSDICRVNPLAVEAAACRAAFLACARAAVYLVLVRPFGR